VSSSERNFRSGAYSAPRKRWPAVLFAITALAWTAAARASATPYCKDGPDEQVLQLNPHQAKKLLLSDSRPSYPPLARINYIRGRVELLVTVDCRGKVERIHVIRGHPFLAVAALDAIRQWVYRPFETVKGPSGFQTLVNVNFSLVSPPSHGISEFPPEPEKFLARSVVPPKLLTHPHGAIEGGGVVRVRVLVSKKGRVVDATQLSGTQIQWNALRKRVTHWQFQPARWWTLTVPWYLDVEVPTRSAM
jgi:TonB family protein